MLLIRMYAGNWVVGPQATSSSRYGQHLFKGCKSSVPATAGSGFFVRAGKFVQKNEQPPMAGANFSRLGGSLQTLSPLMKWIVIFLFLIMKMFLYLFKCNTFLVNVLACPPRARNLRRLRRLLWIFLPTDDILLELRRASLIFYVASFKPKV